MEKRVLTIIRGIMGPLALCFSLSAGYSQVPDLTVHPWQFVANDIVPAFPLEQLHEFHRSDTLWVVQHFKLDTVDGWRTLEVNDGGEFGKFRGTLSMVADLNSLHPYFRDKVKQLIRKAANKGIILRVVEAYRTPTKQREYKTMGRNYTRSAAGQSKHQFGLAVDVVPVVDSAAVWNSPSLWRKVGLIGENLGLRWGGRWRNLYDPGHFEWTGGLGSQHLKAGILPRVPDESYPCLHEDLALLGKYWKSLEIEQAEQVRLMARQNTAVAGSE